MKNTFAIFASVAMLAAYAYQADAGVIGFSSSVRLPTAAELGSDATLAGHEVWDFFVSTDTDILQIDQVSISAGPLYQHISGSDANPPNPLFLGIIPALGADSWITTPTNADNANNGDTSLAGGGFGDPTSA